LKDHKGLLGCMLGPGKVEDKDIQVKYGEAGSSPVFCGRGVRPREIRLLCEEDKKYPREIRRK